MEEPRVPTTPPHSLEAEKSILGSMLLSHTAVEQAMETLCASDFYLARHQDIFQAIKGIYDRGEAIDSVTVIDALDRMGKLASVGGVMYITELSLYVPSAANAAHYIRIVEERSVMRQLIEASTAIASDAFSGEKSLEQMLDDAERAIFNISMKKTSDTLVHISETVLSCYNRVGELMKLNGALTGVTTGFADLDKLTSGMQPSDLIIIAGRPSMGKTAFALNLAQNAAVKGKKTVCIFSLEMSREQLVQRMLCSDSGVNMQSVRTGTITDAELIRIASSLDPLSKASIYIDDSAGCSVAEIRSKCRRLQSRVGLDMVVIDYLQVMQTSGKYDNRVLEICETTRKLKILARELNVPIILLSQLSRGPEQRTDHRPVMADLRESGAIEQDADVIMLLYRPAVYDAEADNTTELVFGMTILMIRNHFNGTSGTELKGKKLGIHAYGQVGRNVARIAKGFDMEIYAFDPYCPDDVMKKDGVTPVASAEELYKTCQFVSLHIPATAETKQSINYSLLSLMPKGALLINTARKEVIYEEDLARILEDRTDFHYVADVAPTIADTLKEKFGNRIFFTPKKMGAQTSEANINAGIAAARQSVGYLKDSIDKFRVNK